MMWKLLGICLVVGMLGSSVPAVYAANSPNAPSITWYRYNRITEEYRIQSSGTIEVTELMTMLYNGTYHSMWRSFKEATSTAVTDIALFDGSNGEAFTYAPERLDGNDPASWGKYTVFKENGVINVEWYYSTTHRVHTWVLRYSLRGAIIYAPEHDSLSHDFFVGFDAPVDTVEATVSLPGRITQPSSSIFTTGGHDFYIDRPDNMTYRFRVSDIGIGERVAIQIGWQKGLVRPNLPAVTLFLWLKSPMAKNIAALSGSILFVLTWLWVLRRRGVLQKRSIYMTPRAAWADMRTIIGKLRKKAPSDGTDSGIVSGGGSLSE